MAKWRLRQGARQAEQKDPFPRSGPWSLRYASRVLEDDLDRIGHAAFTIAQKAIDKKLKVDPAQYGEPLHSPLHGLYKLKASHVRVAYHIEAATREVWVLMIADRRTIWQERESDILARLAAERQRAPKRT